MRLRLLPSQERWAPNVWRHIILTLRCEHQVLMLNSDADGEKEEEEEEEEEDKKKPDRRKRRNG